MQWYKHSCGKGKDPDIEDAISLFGVDAYYVFYRTLEIMGMEFDVNTPGENSFSITFFKSMFRMKWKTIVKILEFFSERKRILFEFSNNDRMQQISLKCPKLKSLCDEYTRKQLAQMSGQYPDTLRTKSGACPDQDTETETDLKKHVRGPYVIKEKIFQTCDLIARFPQKNRFNPYKFSNAKIKDGYHPDIILMAVVQIYQTWDTISEPWGYGMAILKTKQQNYNEKKHIAEAQKFRELWDLDPNIKTLISEIGG